jgi:hypothetical protein
MVLPSRLSAKTIVSPLPAAAMVSRSDLGPLRSEWFDRGVPRLIP